MNSKHAEKVQEHRSQYAAKRADILAARLNAEAKAKADAAQAVHDAWHGFVADRMVPFTRSLISSKKPEKQIIAEMMNEAVEIGEAWIQRNPGTRSRVDLWTKKDWDWDGCMSFMDTVGVVYGKIAVVAK